MDLYEQSESLNDTLDITIRELDKAYDNFKWAYVQYKYEKFLKKFSPAYLSGCDWYQILGDDFRKGYTTFQLKSFINQIGEDF